MKKFVVLLAVMSMLMVAAPVHAQGEVPETLAYYDAQIDVLIPYLTSFQADYYQTYGHYFQALQSHSAIPSVPTPPDNLSGKPEDQEQDLAYFWNSAYLPDEIAWAFRINTYAGPDGDGYVLIVTTVVDSQTWTRSINTGPEEWRQVEWHQVIEE